MSERAADWQASLGAIADARGTSFRVWAPGIATLELIVRTAAGERRIPMQRDGDYWYVRVDDARAGERYGYLVDGAGPYPDPCSRWQPDGVHDLSAIVAPADFAWKDADWAPPNVADLVIYECHIGTLTPEGTFDAAARQLPRLRDLGINALEVMPVAAFPGRWNWGYDGVALFAPHEGYGGPEGFRRFVDAAHAHGIAVVLDVVYNHFGPDGNYTGMYSDRYLTEEFDTPWGAAINFHNPDARRFFVENVLCWMHEYHVDGFRFDATHAIIDPSPVHILAEISEAVERHPRLTNQRPYLIAESHENDVRYLRGRDDDGFAVDAVWADDFHHGVRTILLEERDGYFGSFAGTAEELARTIEQGFLYEGQHDTWAGEPRGTPARSQPWFQFVYCIQNHDQIGNRGFGERLHANAGRADVLAATVLLLLLPQTPMLFQGQEFTAHTPFLYFTDHNPELGRLVTEGRRREFASFAAFSDPATRDQIPDPQVEETFLRSVLPLGDASFGLANLAADLHRDLLHARHTDPTLIEARRGRPPLRTSAQDRALIVELGEGARRRVIAVNFGPTTEIPVPGGGELDVIIASNASRYGGNGIAPELASATLRLPGHAAVYLAPPGSVGDQSSDS